MLLAVGAALGLGEDAMKTLKWVAVGYLVLVGAATMYSNMGGSTPTPTADTIMGLPSPGSLIQAQGTTAAVVDFAAAGALYFFWK